MLKGLWARWRARRRPALPSTAEVLREELRAQIASLRAAEALFLEHRPLLHQMAMRLNGLSEAPCECSDCKAWRTHNGVAIPGDEILTARCGATSADGATACDRQANHTGYHRSTTLWE